MYLVVGAGLSGACIAREIATKLNEKVLVIEKRDQIGGNCYDYIDKDTNILVSKYGPHLFHTNSERVWNYIQPFAIWKRWEHTVLSYIDNTFVSVPVNITTVNRLCNQNLQTTNDMNQWLKEQQVPCETIKNSEQMALSRVGKELYEKLFKPYTVKQWNKDPSELDSSVLARIPIYNNFDTRYFSDKYQALPKEGYTQFITNILTHPNIEVRTSIDFDEFRKSNDILQYKGIIYTGPIDAYFKDANLPMLEYRSIDFKFETHHNMNYFQPNSQVNYPELKYPFTRITEYKHLLHQKSPHTVIVYETSKDSGDPYYPVPNETNITLYNKYKALAEEEEKTKNVHFIGRLANYKYFNMDQAILNALEYFENNILPKK
jgi:UDP-galactopyranose mutase